MRRGGFCSFDDIPRARSEAAERDISLDRIIEKRDVLADDRNVIAQRGERYVSDILAVDQDLALRDIEEPGHEVDDRRFASA